MTTAVAPATSDRSVNQAALWFGLFGGAAAWTVHLIAASIISEWGCHAGLHRISWVNISAVAWALIGLTIAMLLVATIASWMALRVRRKVREVQRQDGNSAAAADNRLFLARTGVIASEIFILVILAQSVPIFFFLHR